MISHILAMENIFFSEAVVLDLVKTPHSNLKSPQEFLWVEEKTFFLPDDSTHYPLITTSDSQLFTLLCDFPSTRLSPFVFSTFLCFYLILKAQINTTYSVSLLDLLATYNIIYLVFHGRYLHIYFQLNCRLLEDKNHNLGLPCCLA